MERLWTKSFILMMVGMFFLFTGFYMLYPTLPLFIKQIGGNESHVGLAMGAFMLSAVILRPIIGGMLDRFGRRSFMVWGLLLFAIAMYMYEWIAGIAVLIALRILHGISWGVSTTSMLTAITDMIPKTRRGEGLGWSGMAMTLAMAIGPLLGIWFSDNLSYHFLFLFGSVLTIAALLLTFGAKMPFQPQPGTKRIEMFEKSVLPVTASVFFLFIAYGSITTFVPLFADSIHVNSGTFFLIYALTLLLVRPIAGKLSDRYGEAFIIVPALAVTILALIALGFSTGMIGVLVSAILFGIGFGSAQPALQAATINLVQPERIGVANASFTTATDLGIGLGAIVLGWVSQHTSYQILFTVSAMSVALSLLLFTFFVIRLLKKKSLQISKSS
ncbi:MFS family permease [Lederbergia wuyishanensis]|uniref:MFS family permease n=2 Tax=Lederbergia wuyishanensis TaxID=1347903 RepID=A0ABU0D5P3_9BACI|nr:MFS transporter [Lederbergia wuyishanensis]MCJ8008297.1 MFS transporter [Lederbergia wuyishanensis]MDQ0343709.1 MFS family permease [Lederbergia wuyishanensis]